MSPSDDDATGLVLGIVFAIVAAVIALVLGVATMRPGDAASLPPASAAVLPVAVPATVPAAAASAPAASGLDRQALSDAASVTVEYGVVKLYFASGKTELAPGAGGALVDVVTGARAGKKVLISGFHDSKGNAALNAEMARRRALAVRDALVAAGVPASQIALEKPTRTAGTGSDEEARRVEISLQ